MAAFTTLGRLPWAFWFVLMAFVVEATAYFGILTLMAPYLSVDLGWGDVRAGMTVSLFTMAVTLFMLGAGSYAEGFGLRRAILFALLISTGGRVLYTLAGCIAMTSPVGLWLARKWVRAGLHPDQTGSAVTRDDS